MKELRRNMRVIGTLLMALFICAGAWFGVTVYTQGDTWASDVYNPRLARSSSDRGDVTDRDGVVLTYFPFPSLLPGAVLHIISALPSPSKSYTRNCV